MNLTDTVVDDPESGVFRVHRSTMTSQEIFDLERQAMLKHCWIYLGHESELPRPGDYVRRTVLGKPLVFLRDLDAKISAFYNTCTHRGATLCRQDSGNARHFQCFYHAWSFDTYGSLIALPDELGYGPHFDRNERALVRPAKLDNYRGFWFVAFNPDIESLHSYLADATEYIDLVVDQATDGMRIVDGTNLYSTSANWKIVVENALDGYHGLTLHQTYFAYVKSLGGGMTGTSWNSLPARDLGNGHSVIEGEAPYGRPVARWDPLYGEDAKSDIQAIRTELFDRCGVERGTRMADNMRIIGIFPNLLINDIMAITVRYVEPVRPDLMHVSAWALAPIDEQGARLRRRIDSYITFIGPGGFATPDDIEALESCQAGFASLPEACWSDLSRGLTRLAGLDDDFGIRTFWRGWHAMVNDNWPPNRRQTPEAVIDDQQSAVTEH